MIVTIGASKLEKIQVGGGREKIQMSFSNMRSQHTTRFSYKQTPLIKFMPNL